MSRNSNDIITYLKWRKDLSFSNSPFNEVDGFILTQLSYFDFNLSKKEESICDFFNRFFDENKNNKINLGLIIPDKIVDLAKELKDSIRYKDVLISSFIETMDKERCEQFSATTFHINDNLMIISYRGTDDSLIGWQEDFKMLDTFPIYSQTSAINYYTSICKEYPKKDIGIVGHSKGGNLSMYVSFFAENIKRIKFVYNYDGPGFEKKYINSNNIKDLEKKENLITTFLPKGSVVGMIFSNFGEIFIMKSSGKGMWQHDGFNWHVERNSFVKENELMKESISFSKELNELIDSLTDEERISLCKSIAKYITDINIDTLTEIKNIRFKLITSIKVFTKKDREVLRKLLRLLIINIGI